MSVLFIWNVVSDVSVGGTRLGGESAFGSAGDSGVIYTSDVHFLDLGNSISELIEGKSRDIQKLL